MTTTAVRTTSTAAAAAPLRVATYCRISDDRKGEGLGVERQREDCDALVAARGWTLVAPFEDNDVSAYSGKERPRYRAMLDAVRAGQVDAIVAWHPDRLHRSPRELEDFLDLVEQYGVTVETVRAGRVDLATATGRTTARIIGAVARGESEHKSDRVRRALEQRASMGTSHGRVAYGWTRSVLPDGRKVETVDEAEADVVRDVAARILRGESLRGIVTDLNERGVPSPRGKAWGKTMLRHVVTRERNVGLRVHHGAVVGDGAWPAILDRGEWEQVRAILTDPARRTSTGSATVHLLSGIARCGVCGGAMRASQNRTVPSYRCSVGACVSRNRADVDAHVVAVLVQTLCEAGVTGLFAPATDDATQRAVAEVAELRARLNTAADDHADGMMDREQYHRMNERLRPRLAAAEARARAVNPMPLLDGLTGAGDYDATMERWHTLPLSRQRAVLDLLLTVRVLRTTPGARTFDPRSVEVSVRASPA